MSEKWILEVKRVQKEYKSQGINLTYQQAMLLARDSYKQIKENPTQPPPPVKVEPAKIPPFQTRQKNAIEPSKPKPKLAPHPYDYGYNYEHVGEYKPDRSAPRGRGRAAPRRQPEYYDHEDYYPPPPRPAPRRPPPRYRYEEGYEYED